MMVEEKSSMTWSCPRPREGAAYITIAHGGGGLMTQRLIQQIFLQAYGNDALAAMNDAAVLSLEGSDRVAVSTDSFVVRPLEFPGGDIGVLAVHGTVNDLAMMGATPKYLTAGFILEEGLELRVLERIVKSMADAAREAGVQIVAGDTKVVERGHGDGVFINTTGIGVYHDMAAPGAASVEEGDCILLSGDIGRHGLAVMAVRENLTDSLGFASDTCNLAPVVADMRAAGVELHWMRDLTRGGLSSAVNELAAAVGCGMRLREIAIPVHPEVQGLCELLGLDPLYVANEGRFILLTPAAHVDTALTVLEKHRADEYAAPCLIGQIEMQQPSRVILESSIGVDRILDMMSGEQLPRIC